MDGKVAVVTGGPEAIGYGCTHTLLNHNISKLFILSKPEDVISDAVDQTIQDEDSIPLNVALEPLYIHQEEVVNFV